MLSAFSGEESEFYKNIPSDNTATNTIVIVVLNKSDIFYWFNHDKINAINNLSMLSYYYFTQSRNSTFVMNPETFFSYNIMFDIVNAFCIEEIIDILLGDLFKVLRCNTS